MEKLVALDPDSFRVHQLKAQVYTYREDNDTALAEYRIVEQARPELPGLHFAIAHLFWRMHENEQALAELQQELRLNPDHAEANAETGAILVSKAQTDEAIPYLEKVLR